MAYVEISTNAIQKEKSSKLNPTIIGYLVYTTLVPMELPGRNHLGFTISAFTLNSKPWRHLVAFFQFPFRHSPYIE